MYSLMVRGLLGPTPTAEPRTVASRFSPPSRHLPACTFRLGGPRVTTVTVALRFGVTPGTLHYFYRYIIEALRELSVRYIVWPSREEREVIKNAWGKATGFPGVIGAIDCTHVPINAPLETPANYVNRHDLHSINVQCVVDNNLLVREIHAGEVGSMNDRRVFRRSALHRRMLERGDDRIIEDDENLVGDGGYTLTDFMMIPFPNNGHLTPEQQTYNRALSQARVRVENPFGLGKGKWRRLKYLYVRDPALAVDHITACFVIHNFLIINGAAMIDDEQLRRPVRPHEILGNENFDNNPDDPQDIVNPNLDDAEEVAALLRAAEDRGAEKRNMIMHRLHNQHA
ncbi:protein ALP1-like [Thrips palmi]|uniref:Protein ALP1-like n=1 Tax=Thrips palmi TaxID=161013 RepID=A0A6P9ADG5_THRPL|nr:protein ALP1-like [Thrips palmi]